MMSNKCSFIALFAFAFTIAVSGAESFSLILKRSVPGTNCTHGTLEVDGKFSLTTFELPDRGNIRNESSIPAGTYKGMLRYDHSDKWRIELAAVPGRRNIQIHIGNYPRDTKGCILVGMAKGNTPCMVARSTEAYAKLRNAFYGTEQPTSTPNKSIELTVSD